MNWKPILADALKHTRQSDLETILAYARKHGVSPHTALVQALRKGASRMRSQERWSRTHNGMRS